MGIPLSDEVKTLLDRPNFAHMATLLSDGSPHSAPVWVGLEGDLILVGMPENTLKAKNTKRDARVAFSLVDSQNPYEEAQIQGRVIERRPDGDFRGMDPISMKYTGAPFMYRNPVGRIVLVIEVLKARHQKLAFPHTPLQRDSLPR